jgi:hypothetical protein
MMLCIRSTAVKTQTLPARTQTRLVLQLSPASKTPARSLDWKSDSWRRMSTNGIFTYLACAASCVPTRPRSYLTTRLLVSSSAKRIRTSVTEQFPGIHGRPYVPWDGVGPAPGVDAPGYCVHLSQLFIPWHRPYMALYEVCLPMLKSQDGKQWLTKFAANLVLSHCSSSQRVSVRPHAHALRPGCNIMAPPILGLGR